MLATRFAWPLAALLAILSLAGIIVPAVYARETSAWLAQAVGQDLFDLVIAVPWIAISAVGARSGSYRWAVLLAGAYAYAAYELSIYAFAVHFNALFLVYCAALGIAMFGLIQIVRELSGRVVPIDRRSSRLAGGYLVAIGVLFGGLWLFEDVPALLGGTHPASLDATGLATNPVHVIDLSFVLPLHVLAGWSLWRQHRNGELLAPILLAFGVLMSASIGGMLVVMHGPLGVIVAMFAVATSTAAILWRALRALSITPRADALRGA